MDILKQITAVPNIHAYLLLQSRGLSALRIRHALLLARKRQRRLHQHSSLRARYRQRIMEIGRHESRRESVPTGSCKWCSTPT